MLDLNFHFILYVFPRNCYALSLLLFSYHSCVKNYSWGSIHVFTKCILFHAMKQIANVCYFYYYCYMAPSIPVKVVPVFPGKK